MKTSTQITPEKLEQLADLFEARATETRQMIARARTTCFPCDMELVRNDEARALEFRRRQLELSRAVYSLVAVLSPADMNEDDARIGLDVARDMASRVAVERGSL